MSPKYNNSILSVDVSYSTYLDNNQDKADLFAPEVCIQNLEVSEEYKEKTDEDVLIEFIKEKEISRNKAIKILEPHKKDTDSLSESSWPSTIDECPLSDEVSPCPLQDSTSTDESIVITKASATEDTDKCPLSAKVLEVCIQNLEVSKEHDEKTHEDILIEFINEKGISPNKAIEILETYDEPVTITKTSAINNTDKRPLACLLDKPIQIVNMIAPTRVNLDNSSITNNGEANITPFPPQEPTDSQEKNIHPITTVPTAESCTINEGASLGTLSPKLVAPDLSQPSIVLREKKCSIHKANRPVSDASNAMPSLSTEAEWEEDPKIVSTESDHGRPPGSSSLFILPPINFATLRKIREDGDEIVVPVKSIH